MTFNWASVKTIFDLNYALELSAKLEIYVNDEIYEAKIASMLISNFWSFMSDLCQLHRYSLSKSNNNLYKNYFKG